MIAPVTMGEPGATHFTGTQVLSYMQRYSRRGITLQRGHERRGIRLEEIMKEVLVLNPTSRCKVNDNVSSSDTTDKEGNNNNPDDSESEHGRPAPRLL